MHVSQIFVVLLLATSAACKYEDTFGRVYDWKREGQSSLRDAIVGTETSLLIKEGGFSVKDVQGRKYSFRKG